MIKYYDGNGKSAKVHVAFGSIGNYELPSHMYLDEIFFINNKLSPYHSLYLNPKNPLCD